MARDRTFWVAVLAVGAAIIVGAVALFAVEVGVDDRFSWGLLLVGIPIVTLAFVILAYGVFAQPLDQTSPPPQKTVKQTGQTNVSKSNVGQIGNRYNLQAPAQPQIRYIPVPIGPPESLKETRPVRTEVFGVSFVCRGHYKIAGTLKLEPQCPEHGLRLKARDNRYSKGELRDPNDDEWIDPVTRNSHLHCPYDGGHVIHFTGVENGERYVRSTQYQEARLMAEGILLAELEATPAPD